MSRAEERRQARETGGSDMTKFYLIFGAVAVIGVGVIGYNVSSGMASGSAAPVEIEGLDDVNRLMELAQGLTRGDQNAPITIVEFGDYQCPSCGAFAQQVKPQMDLALIESGQAKFTFYDFPLVSIHPNAFLAARAARCAQDQGMYWEYHDELFRNQARWSAEASPARSFRDYAGTVGLDTDEFGSCLNSDRHAELVSANMELGRRMQVTGTPTILINNGEETRRAPGFDYQSIVTTIESMSEVGSESN